MAFAVHPGALEAYEQLGAAELCALAPELSPSADFTAHYVRLARRERRVLEFGAGRGNLSWQLASAGARVTGVELSPGLVAEGRARAAAREVRVARRVDLQVGDMRAFRSKGRFPLVVAPESTIQHLYNRPDLEAFLATVRAHLGRGGLFVFDVAVPEPSALEGDYDPVAQVLFRGVPGGAQLAQRQYFPRELEMLLWYNGFRSVRVRPERAPRAGRSTALTRLLFTARTEPTPALGRAALSR